MKRLAWILAFPLLISVFGKAQSAPSASSTEGAEAEQRMFFPRDMFWGWAQLDLAPPHNEIDPMLEVRPFGQGQLRRFMVFGAPSFLFGKNVPQTLYTWSPDAIGIEHSWGGGLYIGKGFEFRVTQHFLFDRLGARDTNLGVADLGNNGPWGRYMTVGVRKSFGTRRW